MHTMPGGLKCIKAILYNLILFALQDSLVL